MFKRPVSISILAGFLSLYYVVMILLTLRAVFITGDNAGPGAPAPATTVAQAGADVATAPAPPIPLAAMPFIALGYSVISFVCTVNMLDGADWARWVYTAAFFLMLFCDLADYSAHFLPLLPVILVRGCVVPFLFLAGANDFFKNPN